MAVRFEWDHGGLGNLAAHVRHITEPLTHEIAKDARRLAPVDTGALRESITSAWADGVGIVSASVDYAGYVELGTSKMHAQPYLRPALYRHRSL